MQGIIDSERGTVIATLKECQARDSAVTEKEVQLEAEVLRLTERLKEETATVNALKRQLLQFSDIAEKYKTILKEGEYEPGMQQVLDKVHNLFATQTNPLGEQYAVQKVLSQYNPQLRAVFLYYAQLDDTFTQHWPPSLAFQQFMLFCKVRGQDMHAHTVTGEHCRYGEHPFLAGPMHGAVFHCTLGFGVGFSGHAYVQ